MNANPVSRRRALRTAFAAALAWQGRQLAAADAAARVRLSVVRGFGGPALDGLCGVAKRRGLESIELLEPPDYPTVLKHGLVCAMGRFTSKKLPGPHINCG